MSLDEISTATGHNGDRSLRHIPTSRGHLDCPPRRRRRIHCRVLLLCVDPLVLIQLPELREHRPADVALETDRGDGVGDGLFHLYAHPVHCGQTGDAVLELVGQHVAVVGELLDVARLVVVCGGQLSQIHCVGALQMVRRLAHGPFKGDKCSGGCTYVGVAEGGKLGLLRLGLLPTAATWLVHLSRGEH